MTSEPVFLRRTPAIAVLTAGLLLIAYAAQRFSRVVSLRLDGFGMDQPSVTDLVALGAAIVVSLAGLAGIRLMGRVRRRQVAEYAARDPEFAASHAELFSRRPMVWALSAVVWIPLAVMAAVILHLASGLGIRFLVTYDDLLLLVCTAVLFPAALLLFAFFQGADQGEQRLATESFRRALESSR